MSSSLVADLAKCSCRDDALDASGFGREFRGLFRETRPRLLIGQPERLSFTKRLPTGLSALHRPYQSPPHGTEAGFANHGIKIRRGKRSGREAGYPTDDEYSASFSINS